MAISLATQQIKKNLRANLVSVGPAPIVRNSIMSLTKVVICSQPVGNRLRRDTSAKIQLAVTQNNRLRTKCGLVATALANNINSCCSKLLGAIGERRGGGWEGNYFESILRLTSCLSTYLPDESITNITSTARVVHAKPGVVPGGRYQEYRNDNFKRPGLYAMYDIIRRGQRYNNDIVSSLTRSVY